MRLKVLKRQPNSKMCFVCGLDNKFGLKSRFYELEDNQLMAIFTAAEEHQGYPGRLHGGIAATILAAKNQNIQNFMVFSTQKTMPPPMTALLSDPALKIDGLLCPGHVSSIIGAGAWEPLAKEYNLACVVGGFETADLLKSLIILARQVGSGDIKVENVYPRAVAWECNVRARKMVEEIFEPADMDWRGLGNIPASGLKIREKYSDFDAEIQFDIELPKAEEPKGCMCGNILKGMSTPAECPLFDTRCTPANPIGPCMISAEGTCAAYFKYSLKDQIQGATTP